MNPNCIAAVTAAAGKALTPAKIKAIDDALSSKMRELARRDRQRWQGMSKDQRMVEASVEAMADIQKAAALKEYRASLQILRTAETNSRIEQQMQLSDVSRSAGLVRDIENVQGYIDATRNDSISNLGDLLEAAGNRDGTGLLRNLGMWIFDLDNPAMTADVVREVFRLADGHTGNAAAKAAAKAWLDTIEGMRQRFNAAGGDIGKLGYGYLSQAHDAVKVGDAGAQAWAQKVAPLMDRNQYLREDGSLMDLPEITQMLEAAHDTISTGGGNKVAPGQFRGSGARANSGSEARVLHFRDGDAWMQYMQEFGQGSLYDSMMGHIGGMARDIGLVENFGPNPEQQFRVQNDMAARADGKGANPMPERVKLNMPDAYWAIVSGKSGNPENLGIARLGQDLRNLQTAAKLGGAVLSSTTDIATIAASLHYNQLPYFDMLKNLGKQFSREQRDFLRVHGVIGEAVTSTLNRWTGDNLTHSLSGRVAGSVMKLSLMNAWTDGLRGAFSATMMQGFAKKAGKAWGDLTEWDRFLMQRKGVTEADWSIISQATPTERNGVKYLTRDAIEAVQDPNARAAATRWMAFVSDEAQFAVINPDMATRAIVTGGGMPAGTIRGEAARAFWQFKSFPTAMITRHWARVFETPQGLEGAPTGYDAQTAGGGAANKAAAASKLAVLAALNVSLMMIGAIVLQNKALVQGKDPFDMTTKGFWARAASQGGGLGYIGDVLLKSEGGTFKGREFENVLGVVAGPSGGAVGGLLDLTVGNAKQAAAGENTDMGSEAIRLTNSNLPYANLWQTRALWEHWVLHNLQEAANPGYLSRMQKRAQKDFGQGYFWAPGEPFPDRAPDFGNMIGE
jgi:hypothetical protein